MASDVNLQLLAARAVNAAPDNVVSQASGGRQAEQRTLGYGSTRHHLADVASYYVAGNPNSAFTPVTFPTSFTETQPFLLVNNYESDRRVYLDYLRLTVGTDTPTGTVLHGAIRIDKTIRKEPNSTWTRRSFVGVNEDVPASLAPSGAVLLTQGTGSLSAVAPNAVTVARFVWRSTPPRPFDEYVLTFGGKAGTYGPHDATALGRFVVPVPPVVIGNGGQALIYLWYANSVPTYSVEAELGAWVF